MEDRADIFEEVREKDDIVLSCIDRGDDDIQLITSSTVLKRSEVDWSFRRLEDMGLVEVESPDGMVERVVDGSKQVFQAPKKAKLTELGEEYLESQSIELDGFESMSKQELARRIQLLESEVEELRQNLEMFKEQVQRMVD